MTLKQIMDAYGAINELIPCVLPYRITRSIYMLQKSLTEEFNIILEAEKALVTKHGGTLLSDGSYQFKSTEDVNLFRKEHQNFLNQESDAVLPRVDVSSCVDSLKISVKAMDALSDLVNFEEA